MDPTTLAYAAGLALASVTPPDSSGPSETPSPFRVEGEAVVREARVSVRCHRRHLVLSDRDCVVEAAFAVDAVAAVQLSVTNPRPGLSVVVEGAPLRAAVAREAGSRTRVTVRREVSLDARWRWTGDAPYVVPPVLARHLFLGQSALVSRRGGHGAWELVSGDTLRVDGMVAVARDVGAVDVTVGGVRVTVDGPVSASSLQVCLEAPDGPPDPTGLLRRGGPVLALGHRSVFGVEGGRVLARAGYELGVGEYVWASMAVETDFRSVFESVVFSAGSPNVLLLWPSLEAGAGVVARQLGPAPPSFGVRLRAGGALMLAGANVDFDYWPADGTWSLTIVGRAGL